MCTLGSGLLSRTSRPKCFRLLIACTRIHQDMRRLAESANIHLGSMMMHHFHIGQTIFLQASLLNRNAVPGLYEIRAVLPEEGGQRRYRVKSLIEPYERVVLEEELSES